MPIASNANNERHTVGNRETAYLSALTTAAVVRAVARACSAGQLRECSCDPEKHGPVHSLPDHTWRPCDIHSGSDNLNFAIKFSKRLIDRLESCNKLFHEWRIVRLHNIAVGRTVYYDLLRVSYRICDRF